MVCLPSYAEMVGHYKLFPFSLLCRSFMSKNIKNISSMLKTYWKNLMEEMGCQNSNKDFFFPPLFNQVFECRRCFNKRLCRWW